MDTTSTVIYVGEDVVLNEDCVRGDRSADYEQSMAEILREMQRRQDEPPGGDPRFHAALREMGALHDKKSADYGREGDPLANLRSGEEFGVPAWVASLIRANDKMIRAKNMARKGTLENESLEDSLLDLANYAILGLVLYREGKNDQARTP